MADVLFNTNDVAKMLQVDKSTVKRWTEEKKLKCFRTPGGHRKFRAEDLYNFMTEYNYGVSTLRMMPQLASDELIIKRIIIDKEYNVFHSVCFSASLKGKKDEIITLFSEVYRAGLPLSLIFDHILKPTLKKLNDTLRANKISILENHLALNSLSNAIIQIAELVTKISKNGKTVVCASLQKEKNDIEFKALTMLLEIDGYTVLDVGAEISGEAVNQLIKQEQPFAVCLYNAISFDEAVLAEETAKVVKCADEMHSQCVLGGKAYSTEMFRTAFPSTKICTSFSELDLISYRNSKIILRNEN